jgi:hypothetical protein
VSFLDSRKNIISVSLLIAVVLIVGAYFLSGKKFPSPSRLNAESTQALLQAYASKDSDADGLPDWEEALYGTSPDNAHSLRADLTDGEAVTKGLATPRYSGKTATIPPTSSSLVAGIPGSAAAPDSLTEQFAQMFFGSYIANRGNAPDNAEIQAFVLSSVQQLATTQIRPAMYGIADINISGTGSEALIAYAIAAEAAFAAHKTNLPYSETDYFKDAVEKGDKTALKNVTVISESYTATAASLAKIRAPKELASQHLAMINAMSRVGGDVADLASVKTDPIRSMLGMQSYQEDAVVFVNTLTSAYSVFTGAGVSIQTGNPGAAFYNLLVISSAIVSATP